MEKNFKFLYSISDNVNIYLDKEPPVFKDDKWEKLKESQEAQNTYIWNFFYKSLMIFVMYVMFLHVDQYLKVRSECEDKSLERSFIEDYQFFLSEYSTIETLRNLIPKILVFLLNQCIFRLGKDIYRSFKKVKVDEETQRYAIKM